MLNARKRVRIITIIGLGLLVLAGAFILGRVLNTPFNAHDPLFFDRPMYVSYNYNNGTHTGNLDIRVSAFHSDRTTVTSTFYSEVNTFNVTKSGSYIDNGTITSNQTFFWIHIAQGMGSEFVELSGMVYKIFDPVGILGLANTSYNLTVLAYTNYWPLEPLIHGAQASCTFIIKNGDTLVAEGLFDRTCGLVFELKIGGGANYKTLDITGTNYDISRNRVFGIAWMLPIAIITPIVGYILMTKVPRFKVEEQDKRLEMTSLIAVGTTAITVDIFIDVWYYATVGFVTNMIIHGVVLGACIGICVWRKYGIKWTIPLMMEIAFITSMYLIADRITYVPYLTAFMGTLLTFIFMIIASGYKKQDTPSKMGKLVTEIL